MADSAYYKAGDERFFVIIGVGCEFNIHPVVALLY